MVAQQMMVPLLVCQVYTYSLISPCLSLAGTGHVIVHSSKFEIILVLCDFRGQGDEGWCCVSCYWQSCWQVLFLSDTLNLHKRFCL